MVNLSINIPGQNATEVRVIRAKVQFAVWVQKYGLVKNVFYRREKSDGVNGEM